MRHASKHLLEVCPWFHPGGAGRQAAKVILAGAFLGVFGPALGVEAADNPVVEALTGGTPYIDVRFATSTSIRPAFPRTPMRRLCGRESAT
jgi:hypothetical protein